MRFEDAQVRFRFDPPDGMYNVSVSATKLHQLEDNLAAADLILTDAEIAGLDAAIPLPSVYPNWFIDNLADRAVAQALER